MVSLGQEAREWRIISQCETFHRNLRVTNPALLSRDSSREASLAWWRVTSTSKRNPPSSSPLFAHRGDTRVSSCAARIDRCANDRSLSGKIKRLANQGPPAFSLIAGENFRDLLDQLRATVGEFLRFTDRASYFSRRCDESARIDRQQPSNLLTLGRTQAEGFDHSRHVKRIRADSRNLRNSSPSRCCWRAVRD